MKKLRLWLLLGLALFAAGAQAIVPSVVVFCSAASGSLTPSLIQSSAIAKWQGAANTTTITLNSVVAGDDIVVTLGYAAFGQATGTVSCNDGSAYNIESSENFDTNVYITEILRLRNVSSGTHSIVCTGNATAANSFGQAMAHEVANDANVAVDQATGNAANSATPTSGTTGTLAQSNEIVFTTACGSGNVSWAGVTSPPTTGYTSLYLDTGGSTIPCSFAYKTVAATTAVSASMGTITAGADFWGSVIATFKGPAGGSCVAAAPTPAAIKWHPGHYMASDALLVNGNTGPLTQMKSDIAVANASAGLAGYGIYVQWGALEQTQGVYDFSQLDTLIALNKTGRHILIQVSTTTFGGNVSSAVLPNYILSNTTTYGGAGGLGQGGVCQGPNGGAAALWRANVGTRFNALLAALGAKYDSNAIVEGIGSGDESAVGGNVSNGGNFGASGCDFNEANYESEWVAAYAVAKVAMPHTNLIGAGVNFTQGDSGVSNAPGSIALINDEYVKVAGVSWPDSPGIACSGGLPSGCGTGFLGGPTWGQSALLGTAGSPGFVYAGKIPVFADVQDFCTPGCIDYTATPAAIAQYGTQTLRDTHIIWDYVGMGGGASGDWTASAPNGILAAIGNFPILQTACPTIYTSGCNTLNMWWLLQLFRRRRAANDDRFDQRLAA